MNHLNILVIEDDQNHLKDAKTFFGGIPDVTIRYAEDLCMTGFETVGRRRLGIEGLGKIDGVISDIFFPRAKGDKTYGQIEPIGVSIMIYCHELKIPCILNTAGYHHGSRYQWICSLQRFLGLPEFVDASSDFFEDSQSKNWESAYNRLLKLIQEKNK